MRLPPPHDIEIDDCALRDPTSVVVEMYPACCANFGAAGGDLNEGIRALAANAKDDDTRHSYERFDFVASPTDPHHVSSSSKMYEGL